MLLREFEFSKHNSNTLEATSIRWQKQTLISQRWCRNDDSGMRLSDVNESLTRPTYLK